MDRCLCGSWKKTRLWGIVIIKKGCNYFFGADNHFDEPLLTPTGKSKAAEKIYTKSSEINYEDLRRWLEKSANIQWDYKNIVKRKGELIRLK